MSVKKNNLVIIGKKATLNYVTACLTLFHSGSNNVVLKARGQRISRAIETVQMLKNAFIKNLEIKDIKIGSQEYYKSGKLRNISTIEIVVSNSN